MGEIVSMVKTGLGTVTCSFAYCVYVYVSVQKLVDKIERKTSSDISFIISIVIHVFHFLLISCCAWTLSSMVHLFINSFDFRVRSPMALMTLIDQSVPWMFAFYTATVRL